MELNINSPAYFSDHYGVNNNVYLIAGIYMLIFETWNIVKPCPL